MFVIAVNILTGQKVEVIESGYDETKVKYSLIRQLGTREQAVVPHQMVKIQEMLWRPARTSPQSSRVETK